MKIQSEQIQALNKASSAETTKSVQEQNGQDVFGNILAKEMDAANTTVAASTPPPLGGVMDTGRLLQAEAAAPAENLSESERVVMENVDQLLNQWEVYAGRLGSEEEASSLKEAYGVLEDIESGVQQLKEDNPVIGESPDLESLVNELEVMAATEKIKCNRGDYL